MCYGWGATHKNRSKIGGKEGQRDVEEKEWKKGKEKKLPEINFWLPPWPLAPADLRGLVPRGRGSIHCTMYVYFTSRWTAAQQAGSAIWNVVDKLPIWGIASTNGDGGLAQATLEAVDGSRLGGFFVQLVPRGDCSGQS